MKSSSVPDIIVRLHLRSQTDGGRHRPVSRYEASDFGCLLWLDAEYFDCRWLLTPDEVLLPGSKYRVAIKLVDRSLAAPLLVIGKRIKMWEGRVIAEGFIEEVRGQEN